MEISSHKASAPAVVTLGHAAITPGHAAKELVHAAITLGHAAKNLFNLYKISCRNPAVAA